MTWERANAVALLAAAICIWRVAAWCAAADGPSLLATGRAAAAAFRDDLDAKLEKTLGEGAAIACAAQPAQRGDARALVLYQALDATWDRAAVTRAAHLHQSLLWVLYPFPVQLSFDGAARAAALLDAVTVPVLVANLDPSTPLPHPERFEPVIAGPGIALWRFPGRPP